MTFQHDMIAQWMRSLPPLVSMQHKERNLAIDYTATKLVYYRLHTVPIGGCYDALNGLLRKNILQESCSMKGISVIVSLAVVTTAAADFTQLEATRHWLTHLKHMYCILYCVLYFKYDLNFFKTFPIQRGGE